MEKTYYNKIIYKKNAFEDLKTYIKLNYGNKNILLISTKSVLAEDVTSVLNALFAGTEAVSHFASKNNFDNNELCGLAGRMAKTKPDLIVSLGGGKCCDVAKYFSYFYNVNYIVCPTVATSLSFFSSYCVNPFTSIDSFYAKMPEKIFIQESIIKNATCLSNISGLCFLHSLRAIFIDALLYNNEDNVDIMLGLEKLFKKLDDEQTNILLCGEDANLVLMDLLIDFGFLMGQLNLDDYYLINMYKIFNGANENKNGMVGKKMLLCARAVLALFFNYLCINTFKVVEKNNYEAIGKLSKKYKIYDKIVKNNIFFNNFEQKTHIKRQFLVNRAKMLDDLSIQIKSINNFSKCVKSVYKYGIEIENDLSVVFDSLILSPYIFRGNDLVNLIAGSGILNSLMIDNVIL